MLSYFNINSGLGTLCDLKTHTMFFLWFPHQIEWAARAGQVANKWTWPSIPFAHAWRINMPVGALACVTTVWRRHRIADERTSAWLPAVHQRILHICHTGRLKAACSLKLKLTSSKYESNKSHIFIGPNLQRVAPLQTSAQSGPRALILADWLPCASRASCRLCGANVRTTEATEDTGANQGLFNTVGLTCWCSISTKQWQDQS